ncbi:MAG TPA: branched-chain amino acid ABC transporter permease [Steroidobacteraceae bacterium]|nr:branched-chain amino acid ABC transporter permease [Hyphomicrobiales bacterium]HWX27498.1 branched-chain amino acid ABC transporter permease [Steroidobacteraceae bacterium]MBV8243376.1 branched-chain amino acid ABC transporter permease [Hyphomicrobiales bacterium]MBV8286156.1 branched-chain amino acid ABC transporter permease [Hyphomicrobiales bacterium]MBV8321080.1 branched-chain amino acid ABC transporter permease [Hyphomicrobiales bacterium]
MLASANILVGGVFHAAVLFLVAAGLQIVFGVQKIVNLACGSFYALGAYFGISALAWAAAFEVPAIAYIPILVGSGLLLAIVLGPSVERLLRLIYDRDEHFQILLTFALVLIFEDAIRLIWGAVPLQTINVYFAFGELRIASDLAIPNYNLIVIAAAALISAAFGWMLRRTRFGRIVRATAENKQMSEALCVDVSKVYMAVFTLGVALGTVGGALVVPAGAASIDMGVELIVDAFAVVIIGGLGSMPGALIGALIVGFVRSAAIWLYPEFELLAIYVIVITVLIVRPQGLLARTA